MLDVVIALLPSVIVSILFYGWPAVTILASSVIFCVLLEYLIRTYTNPGETVLDSCAGSGSTAVACIHTGRNFIGFETDAEYFRKAAERIEAIDR